MTDTTFFRLLADDDKATPLADGIAALAAGCPAPPIHLADPASFAQIPGSPFAYWVSEDLRRKFTELPRFEGNGRTVKQGLATADDFRFIRTWWEISAGGIARSRDETLSGKQWVAFAKGGEYSPYYADLHLVVNWHREGDANKAYICQRYPYLNGKWEWVIKNSDFYFRPGLTWSLRTQFGLSFRVLPSGAVFGHKGPGVFAPDSSLSSLSAITISAAFRGLVSLQMTFGSYEVGVIQRTPLPNLGRPGVERLGDLAAVFVDLKRDLDRVNETSHVFTVPVLLRGEGATLTERVAGWAQMVAGANAELARNQVEIDEIAYRLYGISEADRRAMAPSPALRADPPPSLGEGISSEGIGEEMDETGEWPGSQPAGPSTSSYPLPDLGEGGRAAAGRGLEADLVSYLLGCVVGRWDIRIALNPSLAPALQGPFEPLPVCSPGMLVGPDGLPAQPNGVVSEAWLRARPNAITLPESGAVVEPTIPDEEYPLRIDWDGILVDDPEHADDVTRRLRDVLALLWGERAGEIEQEVCRALEVRGLAEYLRKPGGFFAHHLARYSKSRRQAPIYWPLATASGSYTLWLYEHRLTEDTL